jgi:hypothetical protein
VGTRCCALAGSPNEIGRDADGGYGPPHGVGVGVGVDVGGSGTRRPLGDVRQSVLRIAGWVGAAAVAEVEGAIPRIDARRAGATSG